ncbi:hypothetical protein [Pseudomonas sp. DE0157]|uniref:hypothetical protein n=1 Tax=Pseudomonas sp. DE0157 TaxID=2584952 RepID=UPI0011A8A7EC|nr:hypothetical protein [Pseudomonas sp. DE0157]
MIIGPSHVVRWKRLKEYFGVDAEFLGIGGLPIWHDIITQNTRSLSDFIMVGDFRFGNAYHETLNERDAFVVNKQNINHETDQLMYERSIDSLEQLNRMDVRLVFWCLLIREYKNLADKKYIQEGAYCHPIWNLSELESKFDKSVKLSEVIDQDLDFLFIDSSNHPSTYGYYFLNQIFRRVRPSDALDSARLAKRNISSMFDNFKNDSYIISGTTNTFRLIKDYTKRGILDTRNIGGFQIREADEALFSSHKYHKNLIYFANETDSKPHEASLTFFDKAPYSNKILIIKKDKSTLFYTSCNQQKPSLSFMLAHGVEDEEIVGDIYNIVGLLQVLYVAMTLISKEGTLEFSPYLKIRSILTNGTTMHPST